MRGFKENFKEYEIRSKVLTPKIMHLLAFFQSKVVIKKQTTLTMYFFFLFA